MNYLYLGSTPRTERELISALTGLLSSEFRLPIREWQMPPVDFAFDPHRSQHASLPILEMLTRRCPADARKLVVLIEYDLFIPVLTFVFGHAQLGGRVALVSTARLRQEFYGLPPDPGVFLERARKETLHETGHTFGLVHCADSSCAMALSTRVQQIDRKRAAFCPACSRRLPRGGLT